MILVNRALELAARLRGRRQVARTHGPLLPLEHRTPPGGWPTPASGGALTPEAARIAGWLGRNPRGGDR